MGARARNEPALASACAGAGMMSNVSTVVQLGVVVGLLSPPLLGRLWPALLVSGVVVAAFALAAVRAARDVSGDPALATGRAFEPKQALLFVAIVAVVMLAAAALQAWLGNAALGAVLAVSGFADTHSAAASAAQLHATGHIEPRAAMSGIALALTTNSITKLGLAWVSGGRGYALRLLPGIVAMLLAFVLALRLL
jgi:uncharacterized membrane protein (DUF4010 family)